MSPTNSYESNKILKRDEEEKKKTISNQLKQAGNFFTNHFSVLTPKFGLVGQYDEKLELCFPNPVSTNLIPQIKKEILEQGKFLINYYEDRNTLRITIPEDHLSSFKAKKFNFNQPKFKLDTTVIIEKAEEVKTVLPLSEELNNPTSQSEAPISNQNTNQQNTKKEDNDMAKNDLIDTRKSILVLFKEKGITTKNYWKIEPASDGISLVINCKTAEDAENINKLLVEASYSSKWKKGKMTVWIDVYAGKVPPKKRTSKKTATKKVAKKTSVKKAAKKTAVKKVAKKVSVKKATKIARKVSTKKFGYTGDNVSAQLRMIADQLEKQKSSDPEALFAKLVGDGELMVRTKNKRGSEVLKNISKEAFLACFK